MDKKRKKIILICVIVLVLLFIVPWPMNSKKKAFEFIPGSDTVTEREITVKGWYWNRPFMKDLFRGRIIISGYDVTELPVARGISTSGWICISNKEEEPLCYSLPEAGAYIPYSFDEYDRSYIFGLLLSDGLMRHYVIELFEHEKDAAAGHYSEADGRIVVAGFGSREEAEAWFRKLKNWD